MFYDVHNDLVWRSHNDLLSQWSATFQKELSLCPGLQSTMDEEREEGGPTSKTTLSGEHGRQSKAKR